MKKCKGASHRLIPSASNLLRLSNGKAQAIVVGPVAGKVSYAHRFQHGNWPMRLLCRVCSSAYQTTQLNWFLHRELPG
jgi:hypothetical protein